MDVLSDVLRTLHLNSRLEFRAEFTAPWGFHASACAGRAALYIVSWGNCLLEVEGAEGPIALSGGDMVLLPCGDSHILRDSPTTPTPTMPREAFLATRLGQERKDPHASEESGAGTLLTAGWFAFESHLATPFLTALGSLIHLRGEEASRLWLETILKLFCLEARESQPGAEIATARLMDLLFIQLIRASMAEHRGQGGNCSGNFLRALFDSQLGRALERIHIAPERAWTVAELASEVGMSRTAFAMRFSRVAGIPPLTYATRWRMLKAGELLRNGEATLSEVAARVGYDSEAAFRTAFKREMGIAPGRYRQRKTL